MDDKAEHEKQLWVYEELKRLLAERRAASAAFEIAKAEVELRLKEMEDVHDRVQQLIARGYIEDFLESL